MVQHAPTLSIPRRGTTLAIPLLQSLHLQLPKGARDEPAEDDKHQQPDVVYLKRGRAGGPKGFPTLRSWCKTEQGQHSLQWRVLARACQPSKVGALRTENSIGTARPNLSVQSRVRSGSLLWSERTFCYGCYGRHDRSASP